MHYLMLNNVQSDNQLLEMLRKISYKNPINLDRLSALIKQISLDNYYLTS